MPTPHIKIKDTYSEDDSYFPVDGDYLKALIKVSPFTQEKLAAKADIKSGSTIGSWTSNRSLASRQKVKKVARALGIEDSWPSLILKHPSDEIKKKLEKSRRKARESWERSEAKKASNKGKMAPSLPVSDETTNKLLDQLITLTQAINKLEKSQQDFYDYLATQLEKARRSTNDSNQKLDKLIEINNKHQNYLVGEINKIRLSNHFGK